MKPRLSRFVSYNLCLGLLLLSGFMSDAQQHTPKTVSVTSNCNGYYEYLPVGYAASSGKFPLMIFLHGSGETGNGTTADLAKVLRNGPPKLIQENKFPSTFTVNGKSFSFIVISPQFKAWPSFADIDALLKYVKANYKVDANRVYITGLSMGGGATWEFSANNLTTAKSIAAIVPVAGASWPEITRSRNIAGANLPVWATHNTGDPTVPVWYTEEYVKQINDLVAPKVLAKKTIWTADSHDAWTKTYDPAFRENGLNVYEWMLQYSRNLTEGPPPPNKAPSVNAGSDQTINLPASSVTLSGSATDSDGIIIGYGWSKVSGSAATFGSGSSASTTVTGLTLGTYVFRLTVTDNENAKSYDDVIVTVKPSNQITYRTVPAKIEAESYDAMSGVQTEITQDQGGGQDVGWIDKNDWMEYNINPAASGVYKMSFRIATSTGGQFQVKKQDGSVLSTLSVPNTGGYQIWSTITASVNLQKGNQALKIVSVNPSIWNINWIGFETTAIDTTPTPPTPPVDTTPTPPSPPASSQKIQAESYASMSGVQTENTKDEGGGMDVGWINNGDWMNYNVNVPAAGIYTINFRVATAEQGAEFELRNGAAAVLGSIKVPNTGSFQNWYTAQITATLPAGTQTLRLISTKTAGWNINWFELVSGAPYSAVPGKVEAESYISMNGVLTEAAKDAGNGLNVGWIDNGDWMDYNINASVAGTYTINFRIATQESNAGFSVRKQDGTVLANINVPNTGGYQVWKTIQASVNLPAGKQTIRVISTTPRVWNFNWMEFVSGTAARIASADLNNAVILSDPDGAGKGTLSIYPNPVNSQFTISLNNTYKGAMDIQLVDLNGKIRKQFKAVKDQDQFTKTYQLDNDVLLGHYVVRIKMGELTQTVKVLKL